jgi:hypothetical protein
MTIYNVQCYKCYCSTSYNVVDDGKDDYVGGANSDCGCNDPDDFDDDDDDDDDD